MDDADATASSVMVGMTLLVLSSGVDVDADGRLSRDSRGGMMVPK